MLPSLILVLAAAAQLSPACSRFVVDPGPEQGMTDSALVAAASRHQTGPRDLGTVLESGEWRIIWAAPTGSEHGVFFFKGRRGQEQLQDIWGGAGASRKETFRWATRNLHVPAPLAACFADQLVTTGV